jgi:hypothetical protein
LARDGRKVEARDKLLVLVDEDPQNELAWTWLTGLVDSLDDKIIACENVLTINPANEMVRGYLQQLLSQQNELMSRQAQPVSTQNDALRFDPPPRNPELYPSFAEASPLELAKQYEQDGKFVEALDTYRTLATRTKDAREFDRIYKEITRLEGLQKEKIQYIAPSSSIVRMAFGWPLLYLSLVFVQAGGKFFAYPAWYLWLGVPFVAFGSFLIALSEVKARHPIWKALFDEENSTGSAFARFAAGAMGWLLVIFPHLLLVADSVVRMQHFQIPEMPF